VDARKRFLSDALPFARSLGPWADDREALYDELHAHLVGAAVPVAAGRFKAGSTPRVPDKVYAERRARFIGQASVSAALDVVGRLERANSGTLAERYFPQLAQAWQAAEQLGRSTKHIASSRAFLDFDCIAIDECQDLTPIEAFVLVQLSKRQSSKAAADRGTG
jgi:hypothetical protein